MSKRLDGACRAAGGDRRHLLAAGYVREGGRRGDGDGAAVELAVARGVVVPQAVEDAAARPDAGEGPRPARRVAAAAAGLAVVQFAAADAGRPAQVVGDAGADPGADEAATPAMPLLSSPPVASLWLKTLPVTLNP